MPPDTLLYYGATSFLVCNCPTHNFFVFWGSSQNHVPTKPMKWCHINTMADSMVIFDLYTQKCWPTNCRLSLNILKCLVYLRIVTAMAPHALEAAEADLPRARSLGILVTVCGKNTGTWMSSPSLRRTSTRSILTLLGGRL